MLSGLFSLFTGAGGNDEEIKQKLADKPLILDVRSPAEYRAGALPKTKNVPLDQLEHFAGRHKDKQQCILVCCQSGMRSKHAVNWLKQNGFSDVTNAGSLSNLARLSQ